MKLLFRFFHYQEVFISRKLEWRFSVIRHYCEDKGERQDWRGRSPEQLPCVVCSLWSLAEQSRVLQVNILVSAFMRLRLRGFSTSGPYFLISLNFTCYFQIANIRPYRRNIGRRISGLLVEVFRKMVFLLKQ